MHPGLVATEFFNKDENLIGEIFDFLVRFFGKVSTTKDNHNHDFWKTI